jgi:hypothetical protein
MADELDTLLERVEDEAVRSGLREEIERLRRRRQFGLVFESHLPERVRLPDHPIRRGASVVRRNGPNDATLQQSCGFARKRSSCARTMGRSRSRPTIWSS